eukprot:maker-scaffold_3-snap-gene-4.40-mRNA-1 protein AED:0.03 eAED:0.03 QI:168/0.5/0.66/1/1/1/3/81/281
MLVRPVLNTFFPKRKLFHKINSHRGLSNKVLLEYSETKVAALTLNNPEKHNAFSEDFITELQEKLDKIDADKRSLRAVVLRSNGKNFSAGADLNYMKKLGSLSLEDNKRDAMKLNSLSIPTIGLVQGSSFGGALGLISSCDIVIAAENAKFCFSEAKIGLIPATISPFVVEKIGFANCRKLFVTAEVFGSSEAHRIGLVDDIAVDGDLETKCEEYIKLITANGPQAVKRCKELLFLLNQQDSFISTSTREKTASFLAETRASPEAKEGLAAFLEKRKPDFV